MAYKALHSLYPIYDDYILSLYPHINILFSYDKHNKPFIDSLRVYNKKCYCNPCFIIYTNTKNTSPRYICLSYKLSHKTPNVCCYKIET